MKESFGDGMISNWSILPVMIGAHIASRYSPDIFNKACRRWSYLSIIAIIVLLVLDPGLFVALYFVVTQFWLVPSLAMVFNVSSEFTRGFTVALCLVTVEYANWLSYMGREHTKWKLEFAIFCEVDAACFYFLSECK